MHFGVLALTSAFLHFAGARVGMQLLVGAAEDADWHHRPHDSHSVLLPVA